MARLVIVRRGHWHCSFTKACVFERLGPGYRIAGTGMTFCGPHISAAQLMSHSAGRDGSEASVRMNLNLAHSAKRGESQ